MDQPPQAYAAAPDLCVLTSYFNPANFRSRRENYERFRAPIAAGGLPLLTVECAFGDDAFTLPESDALLRVRAADVLWQKERLLNLALRHLPPAITKVAWVDGDVLFENPEWAVLASRSLEEQAVVQPYEWAVRLPRGQVRPGHNPDPLRSFAATLARGPRPGERGLYRLHGETGLAWAARRSLLTEHGLYDGCIAGGGDHVIAHVLRREWICVCMDAMIGPGTAHLAHLRQWGDAFAADAGEGLGFVTGSVWHLWHGERSDRRYPERHEALRRFAFDPESDLRRAPNGTWAWASDKAEMHRWVARYFDERREDGA